MEIHFALRDAYRLFCRDSDAAYRTLFKDEAAAKAAFSRALTGLAGAEPVLAGDTTPSCGWPEFFRNQGRPALAAKVESAINALETAMKKAAEAHSVGTYDQRARLKRTPAYVLAIAAEIAAIKKKAPNRDPVEIAEDAEEAIWAALTALTPAAEVRS